MHLHTSTPETRGNVIHWAKFYDPLVGMLSLGQAGALRRQTAALAGIRSGDRVLDVGCGTGDLTLEAATLAGATGSVVGIDPSPEMIASAQSKSGRKGADIDFQVGVIEALSFPDRSFDVVVSSLMMHHLPEDLKRRGLAEIRRVLKPDGHLLVVDIIRPTTRTGRIVSALMMHVVPMGVSDPASILREGGFTDLETGELALGVLGFVRGRPG